MSRWTSNNLLSHLRQDDADLVVQHLKPFDALPNAILYDPGQQVQTVYFPCGDTIVSFIVSTEDGSAVETMQVGCEGAVGGIVSQGRLPAYSRIMVQSGGAFVCLPVKALEEAKTKSRQLDSLFARYADCMLAQIFQATACNASHPIEQRAAKWLVSTVERTQSEEILLTQERLSAMLGVGRSYVSRIIRRFKEDGVLTVRRGRMFVHDREKLRRRSCGCNDAVKSHFETVLKGIYPGPC